MTDLHARFRSLDALHAPHLWTEIEARASATRRLPDRRYPVLLFAAVGLLAAALWAASAMGLGSDRTGLSAPSESPLAASTAAPTLAPIVTGSWNYTRSLAQARNGHTATLLLDGRVLVAGGGDEHLGLTTAEIWDPATGLWSATGSLHQGRSWPMATRLLDGTVLIVGGYSGADLDPALASAEIYDPKSGTWRTTGSMIQPRVNFEATLLADGRVLVTGGDTPDYVARTGDFSPHRQKSAEIFNPATGVWTAAASMTEAREAHSATLLRSGKVLVAGGYANDRIATAELYDPVADTWTSTGSLPEPFLGQIAVLLPDGTVLVAGGDVPRGGGAVGSAHAALYDPVAGTWTLTASMVTARLGGAATLLPDGRVLVTGGQVNGGPDSNTLRASEVYDPVIHTWTATADMKADRRGHTVTLLADGRVLVTGGVRLLPHTPTALTELFSIGN